MPAKYLPKVKLKLLTTLEYQSYGELCVPWLVRVLGLLQQYRVDIFSLVLKFFPYSSRILRNPFLVRVFLNMGHKIFHCIHMRGCQVQVILSISCLPFSLMSSASHLRPRLTPLAWSHRLYTIAICLWIQDRQVGLECCFTPLHQ